MRVLQIHNAYRYAGGEDSVVDSEFQLLREAGVQIRQLRFENEKIRLGKVLFNGDSYSRAYSEMEAFRPEIVHVHNLFYQASPSVLKAARDLGIPVVMTLHNFRLICPGALLLRNGRTCTKCVGLKFPVHGVLHGCFQDSVPMSLVLSAVLGVSNLSGTWRSRVNRFLVLTPYIQTIFANSSLGVPREAIVVKPNSTSDLLGHQPAETEPRQGYLYVGRLSEEKGVEVMVEAFNGMHGTSLTLVGTGPLEERIKRSAGPNIRFFGAQPREAIGGLLRRSRALIFPSLCLEGLPNTILEAFSAATPVIASENDNLSQIVTPGQTGLLFKTGNHQALREAVTAFEEADAEALGAAARATYESKYTHQQNLKALLQIYQEVLSEK